MLLRMKSLTSSNNSQNAKILVRELTLWKENLFCHVLISVFVQIFANFHAVSFPIFDYSFEKISSANVKKARFIRLHFFQREVLC